MSTITLNLSCTLYFYVIVNIQIVSETEIFRTASVTQQVREFASHTEGWEFESQLQQTKVVETNKKVKKFGSCGALYVLF